MAEIAFIVGIVATATILLGYLSEKKFHIILLGIVSRILFIIQYVLIGAYEGAAMNACTAIGLILGQNSDSDLVRKNKVLFVLGANALCVAATMISYVNIFSLLPLLGVLLQMNASWFKREKNVRLMSVCGVPFWLSFNIIKGAYGSLVGDVLSFVTLSYSIIRYDNLCF